MCEHLIPCCGVREGALERGHWRAGAALGGAAERSLGVSGALPFEQTSQSLW